MVFSVPQAHCLAWPSHTGASESPPLTPQQTTQQQTLAPAQALLTPSGSSQDTVTRALPRAEATDRPSPTPWLVRPTSQLAPVSTVMPPAVTCRFLIVSDFDHTLSLDDSGHSLAQSKKIPDFWDKAAKVTRTRLVQQGAEFNYLLLHDEQFSTVKREDFLQVGKSVRLKPNVEHFLQQLNVQYPEAEIFFVVVSAGPEDMVASTLHDVLPKENVFGSRFVYGGDGGICAPERSSGGFGKVAIIEELKEKLMVASKNVAFMGDGSSDVHAMLDVAHKGGYCLAIGNNVAVTSIAHKNVDHPDAFATLSKDFSAFFNTGR